MFMNIGYSAFFVDILVLVRTAYFFLLFVARFLDSAI